MNSIEKIRDFFKSNTLDDIEKLDDILELKLEDLIGVSPIHTKHLEEIGIKTIRDMAEIDELPKIKEVPEKVLEKINRIAIMLLHYTTKSGEKKIILLGLDNAGKTSILSILQNKYSIIKNLLPTRGVQRQTLDFLGTSIICWDFGGQVAYRDQYLSRPDLFLESDLIIFAIDVLDTTRYEESMNYLFKIMEIIKELDDKAPLIVDMHKFDPDVQESKELLIKRAELIDKIATKALESEFNCVFINTTIFIKETIDQLFSLALQKMASSTFMLEHLIKEYADKIGAESLSLMTSNNLILAMHTKEAIYENVLMQSSLILEALVDFYAKSGLKKETSFDVSYDDNDIVIKSKKLLDFENNDISLWALFKDTKKKHELIDLDDFVNELKPIVKLY